MSKQINVDELDLPPGVVQTLSLQDQSVPSIHDIEGVNKGVFIKNWMHNSLPVIEDNLQKVDAKYSQQIKKESSVHQSSSSSQSSSSAQSFTSKARLQQSEILKHQLFPAEYKPTTCNKSLKTKNNFLKSKQKSEFNVMDSINKKAVGKSTTTPSEQEISKKDFKFENKYDQNLDADWQAIFAKQAEMESKASECTNYNNKHIHKNIKQSLNMCFCKECEQDIPMELVIPPTENFKHNKVYERRKPPPLMKSNDTLITNVMTAPVDKSRLLENSIAVLTHGHTVPKPQQDVSQTNLLPIIQDRLKRLNFEKSKPVQSFGWQAIMRGNNVVIIHTRRTGKTLTYVPALCSFLLDRDGRYDDLPQSKRSPLIIILGNNSSVAEDVNLKLQYILEGTKFSNSTWCSFLPLSKNDIEKLFKQKKVDHGTHKKHYKKVHETKLDILITTVDTLYVLLRDHMIDLKRLRHLVVENINIILDKLQPRFELVLNAVNSMLANRNCYDGVQFICTGEKWTKKLESFVAKLNNFPLIIIGAHMQAALYGRAEFHLQYVEKKLKPEKLAELLKTKNYNIYKCIVVCKMDEVQAIETQFAVKGINFVTTTDNMTGGEAVDLLLSWKTTPKGRHIVLICTDKALRQYIKVSNATFLVNYSLPPESWTLFSQRFSTLIDSYLCPLTSMANENKFNCQIVTYVDENSMNRYARLANFFMSTTKIPDVLQQYCKDAKQKEEEEKVSLTRKLCKLLFTFGVCEHFSCKDRHILSNTLETASNTPENGLVTGKLVKVRAVNKYYIKLVEYKDLDGKIHSLPDHSFKVFQTLEEHTVFEVSPEAIKGNMYLYEAGDQFQRCVIKEIVDYVMVGDTTTTDPLIVEIFGLENGEKLKINVNKLYTVPASLLNIPPSLVEVYVAHIIPPFKESMWTRNSKQVLLSKLDEFNSSMICTGNILLRLNNTLWLDNLQFRETDSPIPNKLNLTKFLKDKLIYDRSDVSLNHLYSLCKDAGITLPEYKILKEGIVKQKKIIQPQPNWAFIDPDELTPVYFSAGSSSDCIFVRPVKFVTLLQHLEECIASSVLIRRKVEENEIIIGNYYCAVDQEGGNWCRVLLVEINDSLAKLLYVDYGDYATIPIKKLRLIENELLTRLPFQAIECSLYGLKPSTKSILIDKLYDLAFETNSDIYRTLYAMFISQDKSDAFDIPGRFKYTVILLDNSEETININNLLLQLNLAENNPEESFDLIELPPIPSMNTENNDDDYNDDDENQNESLLESPSAENNPEFEEFNDDDFDLIIPNYNPYEDLALQKSLLKEKEANNEISKPAATRQNIDTANYVPMKVAEKDDGKLVPNIKWYQDEKCVHLEFIFTENTNYKITVLRNRFLTFTSTYKGQEYYISINLFDTVRPQFVHGCKTYFIYLTLTKIKEQEWSRLIWPEKKMSNIKYKIEKIAVESDSEEEEYLLQSKDIDDKYFQGAIITADGDVVELSSSEYDSDDSDPDGIYED